MLDALGEGRIWQVYDANAEVAGNGVDVLS
jgi:hypothetical protein